MFYPKRPRSYYMTPTRRQIYKPLIRGSLCALTRRCLKDVGTSKYIIKRVGQLLRQEITSLCSDNFDSILHDKRISTVEGFSWGVITEEMKSTKVQNTRCIPRIKPIMRVYWPRIAVQLYSPVSTRCYAG